MHFRFVPSARQAGPTGAPPQHEWRSSGKRRAISEYKKLFSVFLAEDPQSSWQGAILPFPQAIATPQPRRLACVQHRSHWAAFYDARFFFASVNVDSPISTRSLTIFSTHLSSRFRGGVSPSPCHKPVLCQRLDKGMASYGDSFFSFFRSASGGRRLILDTMLVIAVLIANIAKKARV
jgi:hypothetical protein